MYASLVLVSKTSYGTVKYLSNDQYISQDLKRNRLFEQHVIEQLKPIIKDSSVILDIGSHVGCHSIAYAKFNPEATIHAFEIQTPIYNLLVENIDDNNLQNIIPHHEAMGHQLGISEVSATIADGNVKTLDYDSKQRNYGGVSLGSGGEQVSMITIDSMNLNSCDFIKIDAEGFESLIVMGGYETIKKYLPPIFYEDTFKTVTNEMKAYFNLSSEIKTTKTFLIELGYDKFVSYPIDNYLALHPSSRFYNHM